MKHNIENKKIKPLSTLEKMFGREIVEEVSKHFDPEVWKKTKCHSLFFTPNYCWFDEKYIFAIDSRYPGAVVSPIFKPF